MRREEQLALLKSTPLDEQTINALIEAFGAPKITKDKVDEAFDKFCQWYPKRDGTDPRKPAYEKFRKIAASGVDPDALAHTAKRYRQHCEKKAIANTTYVLQRTTFLTPSAGRYEEFLPKGEEHKWELKAKIATSAGYADPTVPEWWFNMCKRLLAEVGEKTYRSYFDKLMLVECRPDRITVEAESPFMANKISMEYGNRLSDIAGCSVRVVS